VDEATYKQLCEGLRAQGKTPPDRADELISWELPAEWEWIVHGAGRVWVFGRRDGRRRARANSNGISSWRRG